MVTAKHPINLSRTLMQLGHGPRSSLGLTNIFQYINYIRRRDGFFGPYRGLGARLCATFIKCLAWEKALELFVLHVQGKQTPKEKIDALSLGDEDEEFGEKPTLRKFAMTLLKNLATTTAAIVASQPFHVLTIRTMAKFIGEEQKNTGVFASASEIFKESGLSGFFHGIFPRWAGEVLAEILTSSFIFALNTYAISDVQNKAVNTTVLLLSYSLTYPFQVVSTCMAVSGSPHMPIYKDWKGCWAHLSKTNQLRRGALFP